MNRILSALRQLLEGPVTNALLLLFVRITFASIFWRSGETKIQEGTHFTISQGTFELFESDYAGVPLPPHFAAVSATIAEHLFPALLVIGLASRLSATALLGMTHVIQVFVYPDAWWSVHSLWVALAAVVILKGPGVISADALVTRSLFGTKLGNPPMSQLALS